MGAQRQPFQVLFCGQRRGSACGRQGCTAGTSVAVSVPGEQRRQRFPRRSAGRGAGKAPAASRSAGGTLIPTIKHPHGQAETSALLFYPQQFSARCAPAGLPVLLHGERIPEQRKSASAGLQRTLCKRRKTSGWFGGASRKRYAVSGIPALRHHRTGTPAQSVPVRPCQGFPCRAGTFPDAQGGGLRGGAGACGGHSAQKNRLHRAHTPQPVFCWFLWDSCSRFPAHRSRRFLSVRSRFVLCPVGRIALPARYESRPAAAAVLSWLP